jgi:hypothetical protein
MDFGHGSDALGQYGLNKAMARLKTPFHALPSLLDEGGTAFLRRRGQIGWPEASPRIHRLVIHGSDAMH